MEALKSEAKGEDKATNAELKVAFFKPFYGKYWIIDLAAHYSDAVVGDPRRKYLWILSRLPQTSGERMTGPPDEYRKSATTPPELIKTPQSLI